MVRFSSRSGKDNKIGAVNITFELLNTTLLIRIIYKAGYFTVVSVVLASLESIVAPNSCEILRTFSEIFSEIGLLPRSPTSFQTDNTGRCFSTTHDSDANLGYFIMKF